MGMMVGLAAGAIFNYAAGATITEAVLAVGESTLVGTLLTSVGSAIGSGIVGRAVDNKNEAGIEAQGHLGERS
jgi:hypothetical protein